MRRMAMLDAALDFSLELTIENPVGGGEFTAYPLTGHHSLRANGVSDVRIAAFDSFVKKEKREIENRARRIAERLVAWGRVRRQ